MRKSVRGGERGRDKKKDTNRGIKGKRGAYAVKRAHYGRPAATVVWRTVNNCLHLGQCPGGVESEASDGHTHSQTLKYISKKIPFAKHVFLHKLISDTHTHTHMLTDLLCPSHSHISPHWPD